MNCIQVALALGVALWTVQVGAAGPQENQATAPEAQIETRHVHIRWDAAAGQLSAQIEDAAIEEVTGVLTEQGIALEMHDSWLPATISASFRDLPLREAAERLFGKSFILVWTSDSAAPERDPADADSRQPVIKLLAVTDDAGTTEVDEAEVDGTELDVAALEAVVESGTVEQTVPALESALTEGSELLREAALDLIEGGNILDVDSSVLQAVAHEDVNPQLRRRALGVIANRSHEPDSAWSALNHSLRNDPDAEVRDYAKTALSELSMRASWLYGRDLSLGPSDR